MERNIKVIIFDIGGVLITPAEKVTPFILSEICNVPLDDALIAYEGSVQELRTGRLSVAGLAGSILHKNGTNTIDTDFEERYTSFYMKQALVNEDVKKLIIELSRAYIVVGLSNMIELHEKINSQRHLFDIFRSVYISSKTGKIKPSQESFAQVFQDYNIDPSVCYFIDDQEHNITVAKSYGIDGVHYSSASQLTAHLAKDGML